MEVTLIPSSDLDKIKSDISELLKNADDWIDDAHAAKMLGVHTKTLYRYRRLGLLPYSKTARKVYYKKSDLAKYLSSYYTEAMHYNMIDEKTNSTK